MGSIRTTKVAVAIETSRHQIFGTVAVPTIARLSDYANDPMRKFWAVTDATIAPVDEPNRTRNVGFVLVASHEITMISPLSDAVPEPAASGDRSAFSARV